jgi:PST family polysaccharide transporter
MSLVSVVQRSSSFVAQLFLGRLLFEDDYGLFAIALGLTSIGAALRSVLQPVLINHLEHDPEAFNRTYRTTMLSLWTVTAVGVATSSLIESALDAPGLQTLLAILLLLVPFQVFAGFATARISHRLDFGQIAKTLSFVSLSRNVATVAFAFAGLGALSFALGTAVAVVIELVVLSRYASLFVTPGLISSQTLSDVRASFSRGFRRVDQRWVWLSAIAVTLANNGDYTVASLWASRELVGLYYFAFNLTGSFWLLLNSAVTTVLVPGFVSLKTEEEQRDRLIETVSMLAIVGVLFFNAVSVMIVPMTNVLWSGKWDAAIPAILGFSLLAPLEFIHPVVQAIERGTARWSLYFADIGSTAVLTLVAAGIGARFGGLRLIVILVVAVHVGIGFAALLRLATSLGLTAFETMRASSTPWLLGLAALVVAHLIHPLHDPDLQGSLIRLPVFTVMTLALVVFPYRAPLLAIARSILGDRASA